MRQNNLFVFASPVRISLQKYFFTDQYTISVMKANTILQWYSTLTAEHNNSHVVTEEFSCVNVTPQWYRHRDWIVEERKGLG